MPEADGAVAGVGLLTPVAISLSRGGRYSPRGCLRPLGVGRSAVAAPHAAVCSAQDA